MADNVYLLETRLSPPQQAALSAVRDTARAKGLTVFLVGGAVRDLISGSPVRDLDFAVQGPVTELRQDLEAAGGVFSAEVAERQALYLRFPGAVRVEVGATLSVSYPKPGRPEFQTTSILEDLRRRDFTANAMALSLNDGSYGLLMDPLNGVADIENRELRLVSNYGFIEDPVRMIRAARLMARQGWQLEERTRARYETGKDEGYIEAMRPAERNYELEELFHEQDPLRVMRRLEDEGWLKVLAPALSVSKANTAELGRLRDVQMQFQTRGVLADAAAANFPLLTAKLAPAEVEEIRASFPRAGFVGEIEALDGAAKELVSRVVGKEMAAPSAAYRFLMDAAPATVVYAAYSSRNGSFQTKVKSFLTDWPTAQNRIPYSLMAEMRITPEVPRYGELIERIFYALMDGILESADDMRAFLEPYSPPAPPPPVSLRRARTARKEPKSSKGKKKAPAADVALAAAESEEPLVASAEGKADENADDTAVVEAAQAPKPSRAVKAPAKPAVVAAPPRPVVVVAKAPTKVEASPKAGTPKAAAAPARVDKSPASGTKAAAVKAVAPKATQARDGLAKSTPSKTASKTPQKSSAAKPALSAAAKGSAAGSKAAVPAAAKQTGKAPAKAAAKVLPTVKGKAAPVTARPVRSGATVAKKVAPRKASVVPAKKAAPAAKAKARR